MSPKVSVIMPVYNAGNWLFQSVSSILAQTLTDWELIIVNDGSTDDSGYILKQFSDPRIQIYHQANQGVSSALNHALNYCKAPYVARLDADDVALPDRLQKEADFLDGNPDYGLVGAAAEIIDSDGKTIGWHRHAATNSRLQYGLLWDNYFVSSTVMFRRECLAKAGEFPRSNDLFDDYGMWSSIAQNYKVANLTEVLLKYRVLKSGLSHTTGNSIIRQINQRRINIAFHFPSLTSQALNALSHCGFRRTQLAPTEVRILFEGFSHKFVVGEDASEIKTDLRDRFQNTFRLITPTHKGFWYNLLRPAEKLIFKFLLR